MPSAEHPGSFLYLPGAASMGFLNGKERKLDFVLAGMMTDPGYDSPSGFDFTEMLTPEWKEGDVCRLEMSGKEWLFTHQDKESAALSRYRTDPAAACLVREFSAASRNGGAAVVIQTGGEIPAAWRKVTPAVLFAQGRPVYTRQMSPIQWKKKSEPAFFESKEAMTLIMEQMKPGMESLQRAAAGGGEGREEFQAARKALATLVPAPAALTMRLSGEEVPKVRATAVDGRDSEWENMSHPLPEGAADVTVPLGFIHNSPIVKVRMGSAEHWLTLDTGSRFSFLSDGVIAADWKSTLKPISAPTADLHSEDKNPELRKVPEMEIGAWKLQNAVFSIKHTQHTFDSTEPVRGLIGTDMLSLHPFTIDWPAGKLTLYRREGFVPPAGAQEVALGTSGARPTLPARLEGAGEFPAILDTGFSGMLLVPGGFRAAHSAAFEGLRSVHSSMRAPNGWVTQRMNLWPAGRALDAAGLKADGGFGLYEASKEQGLEEAVLGGTFFAGARLTFDLENNRLWVLREPARPVKERIAAGWKLEEPDATGYTALGRALMAGNLPACEELAAAGASLTVGKNLHAMIPAVQSGNPAVVEWVAARDREGAWKKSPVLASAIRIGAPEIARWLLEHGISREANLTAMGSAAFAGDVATAQLLQKAGYPLIHRNGSGEEMALATVALEGNQPEFLKWLVTVDREGLKKTSPPALYRAATLPDAACLKVLLDAGLDPASATVGKNTPLHVAAGFGRTAALELLLQKMKPDLDSKTSGETPLLSAIKYGQAESVKLLLARGANPEGPEKAGIPLYFAALFLGPETRNKFGVTSMLEKSPGVKTDYEGCVRELLHAGANPLRPQEGSCAAEAIAGHSNSLTKLCLEKGATPEHTPLALLFAAENDRAENVTLLLSRGWKPDQTARNVLPLQAALKLGLTGVVQALVNGGADLKKPFPDGTTPLHCAARHNDPYLISILAKAGADLNSEDDSGLSPLATAIEWRMLAAARALIQAGADPLRKSDAFTPAEMAAHLDPKYPALEEYLRTITEAKK